MKSLMWLRSTFLCLGLVGFLSSPAQAQSTATYGTLVTSLNTSSTGAVTGTAFAVPSSYAALITWTVTADGSALSVNLLCSNDNTTYFVVDTITVAAGAAKQFGFTACKFIRIDQVSRTGGTATVGTLVTSRGFITSSSAGNLSSLNLTGNLTVNGQGLFASGTDLLPSISFIANPTTGIYLPSLNTIGFSANAALRIVINAGEFKQGSTQVFGWTSGAATASLDTAIARGGAAGVLTLSDNAGGFTRLNFGCNTSSCPSIKRNGNDLDIRFADDSGYTDIAASSFIASGGLFPTSTSRVQLTSPADGQLSINNSTGTVSPIASGTLTTSTTSTCTAANTTETDLWTYTLPAGALSADGRGVRVTVWGTTAANANNKTVRTYFGASALHTGSTYAANNKSWRSTATILRSSATAQTAQGDFIMPTFSNPADNFLVTTPAETMANAIVIKATGQNGTASANDICVKGAIVETIK